MSIDIVACPHPFKAGNISIEISQGKNIYEIITKDIQTDESLNKFAHVYLNDEYIPQEKWGDVFPKDGDKLIIRIIPQGGGGKNPFRMILMIVVTVVATYAAGAAGAALAEAGLSGGLLAGAKGLIAASIMTVGSLAVNALVPPPSQDLPGSLSQQKDAPTYAIEGARNQPRFYQPVRVIYGRHRIVPDYGALPYSTLIGNDQYFNMLFVWGYGELLVEDLKIGETPIDNYSDVEYETVYVEDSDTAELTLFPSDVYEENVQSIIRNSAGWISRVTQENTDEAHVDFYFPRLFQLNDKGDRLKTSVNLEVRYAPVGTQDWTNLSNQYYAISGTSISFADRIFPGGYTRITWRYWIQIDKITGRIFRSYTLYSTSWPIAEFKSSYLETEGIIYRRETKIELIDRRDLIPDGILLNDSSFIPTYTPGSQDVDISSGSLFLPYFNVEASSTSAIRKSFNIKFENNGQYTVSVRRVTADSTSDKIVDEVYFNTLRSITNEKPLNMDNITVTAMRIRATEQLSGVIDQLNGVVTSVLNSYDSDTDTWVYGAATRNPADHFLSVLQGPANKNPVADDRINFDSLKEFHNYCSTNGFNCDFVIEGRMSIWNVLKDILSTARSTPDVIDGQWGVVTDKLKTTVVQHFTPRNSWDFSANKIFNDRPHAWNVKFLNREQGYKQDTRVVYDDGYSASNATKFEDLDLKGITDPDLAWKHGRYFIANVRLRPEVYSFKADVEHIVCTRGDLIRVTNPVPLWGIKSARVKSVTTNGGLVEKVLLDDFCTMEEGKFYFIRFRFPDGETLLKEVVTEIGNNYELTFKTPFSTIDAPQPDDLIMFGEQGLESVELIVKSIEPSTDMTATLVCLDASPAIHTSDQGAIPDFDTQITIPATFEPPVPTIIQIISDDSVLIDNGSGYFSAQIVINFSIPTGFENIISGITVESRKLGGDWVTHPNLPPDAKRFNISEDVFRGDTYDLRIRTFIGGVISEWTTRSDYTVVGKTDTPSNVTAFSVRGTTLSWEYPGDMSRIVGFRIKRSIGINSNWTQADYINRGDFVTNPYVIEPTGNTATYLVKAFDFEERESESPSILVLNLGDVLVSNIHEETILLSDPIYSVNDGNFWLGDTENNIWTGLEGNTFFSSKYSVIEYVERFIPKYTSANTVIDVDVTAPTGALVYYREPLAGSYWSGTPESTFSIAWSASNGEYELIPAKVQLESRYYDIKVVVNSSPTQSSLNEIKIRYDFPDIEETLEDISISASGTRLPITKTYTTIKNVNLTLQDDGGSAVTLNVSDKNPTLGPFIYAEDKDRIKTTATIDARIQGY